MRWIGGVYSTIQHLDNPSATKLETDEWPSREVVVQFELDIFINLNTVEPAASVHRRTAHPGRRGYQRQTLFGGDIHKVFARPNRAEPRPVLRGARTNYARDRWWQNLVSDAKRRTPSVKEWQPTRSDFGGEHRNLRIIHVITLCRGTSTS